VAFGVCLRDRSSVAIGSDKRIGEALDNDMVVYFRRALSRGEQKVRPDARIDWRGFSPEFEQRALHLCSLHRNSYANVGEADLFHVFMANCKMLTIWQFARARLQVWFDALRAPHGRASPIAQVSSSETLNAIRSASTMSALIDSAVGNQPGFVLAHLSCRTTLHECATPRPRQMPSVNREPLQRRQGGGLVGRSLVRGEFQIPEHFSDLARLASRQVACSAS